LLVAVAVVALLAAIVTLLDPVDRWFARRATALSLLIETPEGEAVRLAHGAFLDGDGRPVATASLTGHTWTITETGGEADWGRRVAVVRLDAFGCRVDQPLTAGEEATGSFLGGLSPHPTPRRVTQRLEGTLLCQPLPPGEGLSLGVLLAALDADSEELRDAAVEELERIGFAAAPAVSRLAALVEGAGGERPRCPAARALGAVGPPAGEAVPALAGLAASADPSQVRCAVRALERIGPAMPGVVDALAAALGAEHPDGRLEAARVLGRLGPDAVEAVPALVERLLDEEEAEQVRLSAFSALKAIGTPAASKAMRRYAEKHPILY
jgi:hypothetical protein